MIRDGALDGESLAVALDPLLADAARRTAMGEAARALGRPDATARFADLVEATARPGHEDRR